MQQLVASLVLGYLENQHLDNAYTSFCETSRHLVKEKQGLKCGNKPLDTSIGLVNIIRDYFTFKSLLNEFLRSCPQSPTIIRLIDSGDSLQRLEIILDTLKNNLHKIDKVSTASTKKRKHDNEENVFNLSHSKTSTPEIVHLAKRLKNCLTTPHLTLSTFEESKSQGGTGSKLLYSSSDSSNKEDDDEENLRKSTSKPALKANTEQLSETFLQKPEFVDKVVDIINRTRSAKEAETKKTPESGLTNDDLNDILSKTQNDPSFDEIVNDIVNKYLLDCPEPDNAEQISSALDNSSVSEDVPIKQRLRPRNEKNTPAGERKKKINIISNEIYTGVLPEAANISSISVCVTQKPKVQQVTASHSSLKVVEKSLTLQAFPLSSPPPIVKTSEKARLDLESENKDVLKAEASKKESTPKTRINQSFLDSKSKSTPRRKATHVRILDFNHTPSNRKLFIIKELSTPRTNGIPAFTPGSAPASFSVNCTMKCSQKNQQEGAAETVDDNSNSNSISHTPKVVKGRRRRKIAVSKSIEKNQTQEELKQPNMSLEDWFTMRKQSKDIPIDQLARKANEKAETEGKTQGQKRKTQKRKSAKRKVLGGNQKRMSKISKEQKENEEKKDEENSTSIEYDENKPLIKFKIKSPRKNAATKKKTGKSKTVIATVKLKPDHGNSSKMIKIHPEDCPSSLNRSDTVQEVATMLTTLSETILAKDNNIKKMELLQTPFKDLNVDAETPFKDNSLTPLPNTPRFAIPLMSQSNQTPMPKTFDSCTSAMSLVKLNDILTPSFPITPGLKETPLKEIEGSPTSAGNYSSRRTDYSSCSSYYKPDESEDITSFLNPRTRSNHMSQSESDAEKPLQIVGSTKKVECPGAIERVKSFENKLPTPHYTMMDEGLLSESLVGTATEDSSDSSSSFTCSTCSTDPSDEENTIEKLNKVTTDIDSEWNCDDDEKDEITSTAVVNEKTGEVRFPLRNWITPKKVDVESQSQKLIEINALENAAKLKEHRERMKEIRVRTLEKIRLESAIVKPKNAVPLQQKYRRSNAKAFKLPSEETRRQPAHSRKDQILQQNLTERPRPTPLKLIHASSSSRRKNATPRKTIIIDELPRQISPPKKKREKKAEISYMKSSVTALESVNDNAVTLEPNLNDSLNISSSFTASIENDSAHAVFARNKSVLDGGSIHESDKYETITIQNKLADKHLSELDSSSGDDNEEDALEIVTAEKMRKNEFYFVEPDDFQRSKVLSNECVIPPMIIHFEGKNITLNCSGVIDIFSLDPVVIDKCDQKKNESPKSNKEKLLNDDGLKNFRQGATMRSSIKVNIKEKEENQKTPSLDINSTDISAILDKLHGK